MNYLVVGPWHHGGWSGGTGDALGAIPFGSDTAEYFRERGAGAVVRALPEGQGHARLPARR